MALVISIAIASIVSGAALIQGASLQRRAHEAELLFIGAQFQAALKSYYETTPAGQIPYPMSLDDLIRDTRQPVLRRHLRKIYFDPLTGKPEWGTILGPSNGIVGIYSLYDGAAIKTANFPTEFAEFEGKERVNEWIFSYKPAFVAAKDANARR